MDVTALLLSTTSVRLHDLVPHHLPSVHDRTCRLAHRPRGAASQDGSPGLSSALRVLAENIRRGVWIWCRLRNRDGVSVRHQLECLACENGKTFTTNLREQENLNPD